AIECGIRGVYKIAAHGRLVALPTTFKRLNFISHSAATMRHVFICTLLFILPIPVHTRPRRSLPQPPQTKGSDLSRNSASMRDWANRVMSNDPKVRASAEAALVQGAQRSLPLLRRFLNSRNEDLHRETFEIIRRIGPPAIPLLVGLLRHQRTSFRRSAVDSFI